jgi:hypothetical protein
MGVRIITLLTTVSNLFLCSLQILSNPEFSECICWNPHGRSWRILKPPVFEQVVIPLYFRHAKYASFMRQVNGWGFKRIVSGNDHNSYYHEMFVREFPQLCLKMNRVKKGEGAGEKTKKSDEGAENNDALDSQESSDQQGEALAASNQYQQASAQAGGNDGNAMGYPGLAGYTGGAPPAGLAGFPGGAPPGAPGGLSGLAGFAGGAPTGAPGGSAMSALSGLSGLTGGEHTGANGIGGLSGLAGLTGRAPPGAPGGGIGGLAGLAGMTGGAPPGAPGGGIGGLSGLAGMTGGAPGGAPGGGIGGLSGLAGLTGGAPGGAPGGGIDSAMILKFQEALAAAGGPNALLQQHQQQQLAQPSQNLQAGNNFGFPNQNAAPQLGGQNPALLAAQLQAATQKAPSATQNSNHNDNDSDDDDLDDDDDNSSVTSGEAV